MPLLEKINHFHQVLWNEKNTCIISDLLTDDAKICSPLNTVIGPEALKKIIDVWFTAFPDLTVSWGKITQEKNKVIATWQATGTHQGTFLEIAPTHKSITYEGTTTYHFTEDKISKYLALIHIDEVKKQLL